MNQDYSDTLKGPDKQHYERKFRCLCGNGGHSDINKENNLLDPHKLGIDAWIDDVSCWP